MPDWIAAWVPGWAEPILGWLLHPVVITTLGAGSVALFLAGTLGLPLLVARMPADYFSARERIRYRLERPRPCLVRRMLHFLRNLLGLVLLLAGVAMLVLPGQGLLTILVALLLIDFPAKHRIQRRLLLRPGVLRSVNHLRRRAGRPPLQRQDLLPKDRTDDR
jgi:hypothetical protein